LNEQRCTEVGRSTAVGRVVSVRKGVAAWKLSDIFEVGPSPNGAGGYLWKQMKNRRQTVLSPNDPTCVVCYRTRTASGWVDGGTESRADEGCSKLGVGT
jgi:hypothetical protein